MSRRLLKKSGKKLLRNPSRRNFWQFLLVLLLVGAGFFWEQWFPDAKKEDSPAVVVELHDGLYEVVRNVDGDTLLMAGKPLGIDDFRIRLLGVDTPETVKPNSPVEPFGKEASDYVKQRLRETLHQVYLQFDTEKKDKYGRFLAWVWLDGKQSCLNEELVRSGLARPLLQYPFSTEMKFRLQRAAQMAQEEKRGIWSIHSKDTVYHSNTDSANDLAGIFLLGGNGK
ncbi:MAG: thermonuclease family protein [Planctomycetia bacterium]|nr:thermonuclease family protein [Planctomycetia bacterium]